MSTQASDSLFIRRVLIVALIVALLAAVWLLSPLLLLAFGAVLVATAIRALAWPIIKLGAGDTLAILITALLVTGIVTACLMFFGAEIAGQWQALNERLSAVVGQLAATLGVTSFEEVLSGQNAAGLAGLIPNFVSWSASLAQALFGASLVAVGGIYMALDPACYRNGFIKLVPPAYQANAIATMDDIGESLHRWLGGVLVAMVLVGLLTSAGLWFAGVQSPLALGLLAGLANAVPYIGSLVAAVITVIIAAGQSPQALVWAIVVMAAVQQIESNVITPLAVGGAVSIPPATGLFAIVAMALLFGPLGVLFGFPLAIVIDIVVRRLYIRDALDEPVEILGDAAQRSQDSAVAPPREAKASRGKISPSTP